MTAIKVRKNFGGKISEVGSAGCQMVCFQTKNTNLGKFLRALDWKMMIYYMAIWNILLAFGIFYDHLVGTFCVHLVHFLRFWYHAPKQSGNYDRL
jgi:hypothetical protein